MSFKSILNGIYLALVLTGFNSFAFTIPDQEEIFAPDSVEHWSADLMTEDNGGVLIGVRDQLARWEQVDEYADNWGVKSTGLYETPELEDRKAFVMRQGLRYLDNRISGEMKNADKGSALAKARSVQKALRPTTSIPVVPGSNVRIKVRAKVLQMRGSVIVENPYVEANADIRANGDTTMNVAKNFESIGMRAHVSYQMVEGVYRAVVNKRLTNTISTQLSSVQHQNAMVMSNNSDRTLSFLYSKSF